MVMAKQLTEKQQEKILKLMEEVYESDEKHYNEEEEDNEEESDNDEEEDDIDLCSIGEKFLCIMGYYG